MLRSSFLSISRAGELIATAIHDGHLVRPEVERLLAISGIKRRREEDPYTAILTDFAPNRLIGLRSRFEVDLNRPREKAVYIRPEDCWGLQVWREPPSPALIARSLQLYEEFYTHVERVLNTIVKRHGRFVVLDLHSYNHRRNGPAANPADPAENPEVNIGTGSADRSRWGDVIDGFIERFSRFDFLGRHLDVRENVKFSGGHFPQWIHRRFGGVGLAIAVELKKFWMDEWTGLVDEVQFRALHSALRFASTGLAEARAVT